MYTLYNIYTRVCFVCDAIYTCVPYVLYDIHVYALYVHYLMCCMYNICEELNSRWESACDACHWGFLCRRLLISLTGGVTLSV